MREYFFSEQRCRADTIFLKRLIFFQGKGNSTGKILFKALHGCAFEKICMGVLLKKTGCGVPQKYLRDAALFQKVGSGRAAVGAEFSAPTAAVLLSCRPVVLPPCRLVVLLFCRLYKRPIFAADFSGGEKNINSACRGIFAAANPVFMFFRKK